jgi:uncharacterized protein YbcI
MNKTKTQLAADISLHTGERVIIFVMDTNVEEGLK